MNGIRTFPKILYSIWLTLLPANPMVVFITLLSTTITFFMTKLSIKYFNSDLCLFMSVPSFDWSEISKSKKGVRTSDNKACGEVISTPREEIFIVDGA